MRKLSAMLRAVIVFYFYKYNVFTKAKGFSPSALLGRGIAPAPAETSFRVGGNWFCFLYALRVAQ